MAFDIDSPEFQHLQARADRVIEQEAAEGIDALTPEDAVFFLVWISDGEVDNGGMVQLLQNSTGNYLARFPDAFRAIGASRKALLFEELIGLFGAAGPSPDWDTRVNGQFKALPQAAFERMEDLDERWYALDEDVDELLFGWN